MCPPLYRGTSSRGSVVCRGVIKWYKKNTKRTHTSMRYEDGYIDVYFLRCFFFSPKLLYPEAPAPRRSKLAPVATAPVWNLNRALEEP